MPTPLLEVRNLSVEFPGRRGRLLALDDISFDIAPGEILGVVGESGAGKSLTGASIIGLLDPPGRVAGGEIRFDGRRIDNLPYEQMRKVRGRSIGAIFQDPLTSLDPLYTVGQQLVETIQTHLPMSGTEARRRAVTLLQETGIPAAEQRLDQYPHQFSGGMRRASSSLRARRRAQAESSPTSDEALAFSSMRRSFRCEAPVPGAWPRRHAGHPRHGRDRRDLDPVALLCGRIVEIGRSVPSSTRPASSRSLMGSFRLWTKTARLLHTTARCRANAIPMCAPFIRSPALLRA